MGLRSPGGLRDCVSGFGLMVMAWRCGCFVLWLWGRSSVVEHLLCKQGAVGSIPTVSKRISLVG